MDIHHDNSLDAEATASGQAVTCEHEWKNAPQSQVRIRLMGHRRQCQKCWARQIWRIKVEPGPDNAPELGEWHPTPEWIDDYMDYWS